MTYSTKGLINSLKECSSIILENQVKTISVYDNKVYIGNNFFGYIAKQIDNKIIGVKTNGQKFEIIISK